MHLALKTKVKLVCIGCLCTDCFHFFAMKMIQTSKNRIELCSLEQCLMGYKLNVIINFKKKKGLSAHTV